MTLHNFIMYFVYLYNSVLISSVIVLDRTHARIFHEDIIT